MGMQQEVEEISQLLNPVVEDEKQVEEVEEIVEPETELEEEEPEAQSTEESESNITNIAGLAEAIEVEPAFLYDLDIGMGDGQEPVKLGKLKDDYQAVIREKANLETKLAEQQTLVDNASNGVNQSQQLSNDELVAMGDIQAIGKQYQQIDWSQLEKDDPGQWAATRQKFVDANNMAQNRLQQVKQQKQQIQQQNMVVAEQKMMQMIPEWSDQAVKEVEQGAIRDMLVGYGVTMEEIQTTNDPRLVKMFRELSAYKKRDIEATEAVKQVRSAPKVLKGRGRAQPKDNKTGRQYHDDIVRSNTKNKKTSELNAVKQLLGVK